MSRFEIESRDSRQNIEIRDRKSRFEIEYRDSRWKVEIEYLGLASMLCSLFFCLASSLLPRPRLRSRSHTEMSKVSTKKPS